MAVAAVLWAVGGAYASRLIDQGASLVELTEARAWITALVLGVAALIRRPPGGTGPRPAPWLVVLFGLSIAAANVTYYGALARLPVAVAITTQYTAPGLVVLWVVTVDRERLGRRTLGALCAAVVGVALLAEVHAVFGEDGFRLDGVGFALAGISAFAYATYMVTGERVGRALGARRAVLEGFIVASVLWLVVQLVRGLPDTLLEPRFAFGIAFLAVATTVAPFLLFVWGMERIKASDASIVSTLEPLAAAVIAFFWLHQSLSPVQIAGGLLVIAGIGLVQAERPSTPEVMTERAAIE